MRFEKKVGERKVSLIAGSGGIFKLHSNTYNIHTKKYAK